LIAGSRVFRDLGSLAPHAATRWLKPVIRLSNIALAYEQGPDIRSEVNFHLRPGSFHFLTGPSGAGKTSLLRLLFM